MKGAGTEVLVGAANPAVPQIAPILALHRHQDGYVTFSVKSDDDFRNLVAIKGSEMETYFPEFIEHLSKDSYVSINADYRLGRKGRTLDGGRTLAFGHPKHDTASLRYLCACYVDIDYYSIGADYGTVLGQIVSYWAAGTIPPASIIVRSGRGMWLLWLLRDPKLPDQAERAFDNRVELYAKIQRAIGERLLHLGADIQARDAARHIRIPGSLHTGSERNVEWSSWGNERGGYTYTLPELAQFFGVEVRKLNPRVKRLLDGEVEKKKSGKQRNGWDARHARGLRDFLQLMFLRGGGFDMGCRNRAALLYALLLRRNGWNRYDAAHEVTVMALECHPCLKAAECRNAVKTAYSRKASNLHLNNQYIADCLMVTPAESALLERIPPAQRFGIPKQITPKPARSAAPKARRLAILEIVGPEGNVPPCREMVGLLAARGINAGHVSIAADYRTLGLKTKRIFQKESKRDAARRQSPFPSMA